MATISKITYYLPKTKFSNLNHYKSDKIKKIIKKIGINNKFVASSNQTAIDLATSCLKKFFKNDQKQKKSINFLIYCTQSPEFFLPSGSSIIQKEIFQGQNIAAIDVNLGCSGYVYSLSIAKALVDSKIYKNVLIVTSETYSKFINRDNIGVAAIFGDGASATLVEPSRDEIFKFDQGTDGSGYLDLIVPASGLGKIPKKDMKRLGKIKDGQLYMNGTAMFNFAINEVPKSIKKTLTKNKMKLKNIDFFILHQANKYMLETIRDKLKISKNKFYINLKNVGNTTSSSIPISIYRAAKEKRIKKNMKVLLCGFGVGFSWSSCVINISSKFINSIKN